MSITVSGRRCPGFCREWKGCVFWQLRSFSREGAERVTDTSTIGQRIAHARKLRGLTQAELALRVPCSKSLIAQVERGHKPATPSLIIAVARVLNVEVTELTGQP